MTFSQKLFQRPIQQKRGKYMVGTGQIKIKYFGVGHARQVIVRYKSSRHHQKIESQKVPWARDVAKAFLRGDGRENF